MSKDDYEVGYGRPPASTRFQKGQSGNPGGRAKSEPSVFEEAAAVFDIPVKAAGPKGPVTMTTTRAMYRKLCKRALAGDRRALKQVFDLVLVMAPLANAKSLADDAANEALVSKAVKVFRKVDPERIREIMTPGPQRRKSA
jgi:uncharacterized Fe-S center protein